MQNTWSARVALTAATRCTDRQRAVVLPEVEGAGADEHEAEADDAQADHLDRDPALLAPVDVVEVQDQRELVEDERRADADEDRGGLGPGALRADPQRQERADEQEDEPRHGVVHVHAALRHVVLEGTLPGARSAA